MILESLWLALLGVLLGGYFVLGGLDYGAQVLRLWLGGDESARRSTLGALGPFFFGNEVWLVGFAGVLFGAFPFLEGKLLSGMYPLFLAILIGLVVGKTAVQLRGRADTVRGRRVWDVLAFAGGLVPAWSWGMLVALLLRGVPIGADGHFTLTGAQLGEPFVLACGAASTALFVTHGAAFLAARVRGAAAGAARALLPRLGVVTVVASLGAGGIGVASAVDDGFAAPAAAVAVGALLPIAVVAAMVASRRGWAKTAVTATGVAALVPALLPGVAHYPRLLVSTVSERYSVTVSHAAADVETLKLLSAFGIVVVPVILLYQGWSWWAFRERVDSGSPTYF
ncbi:cytochrome d ubiquinol oxidase subunit II [Stackebrandtia nassauensis]|uniref:Cytochrome d ubiquinol oxidase, subunit II n=1 Tax=Stackebrandtia nassauensis (strain DSM 44728 / CIP 108903 / NRRL B-16338 / NBRC 102104 / LLR-40K-21) TaxID=446470 RepID=D3QB04_STANL|nr:cytochrome d ubiquinol oxidase subunit II [Stackebrandtia nassauensis]ADD40821.1 cytochrome d ubiquinol oxidase, subunit II [Stackebrandtia nassauensis DSM 44728]